MYMSNDRTPSKLSGSIPASIGNLTEIKCMVRMNVIGIGCELTNLYCQYWAHNELSGTLPESMSRLTKLQGLFLRLNRFHGIIPDLSGLTDLRHLVIDFNRFEGGVPWLAEMNYLHSCEIRMNNFTGVLPDIVCGVHHCTAYDNNWSCPLPQNSTGANCCQTFNCINQTNSNIPTLYSSHVYEDPPTPYVCNAP